MWKLPEDNILLKMKVMRKQQNGKKKTQVLAKVVYAIGQMCEFLQGSIFFFLCLVRDKQVVLRFPLQSSSLLLGT